jgi:signal transduction histidine kinase/ActR/RegA family two-component response regulator
VEQATGDVTTVMRLLTVIAYVGLAVLALSNPRRSQRMGRWLAAAFGALAIAVLAVEVPALLGLGLPQGLSWGAVALLLAFPWLLLRFTASLAPLPPWVEVASGVAFLASVALLPGGIDASAGLTVTDTALLLVGVVYWVGTSAVTATRLWIAGNDQPCVARWSMHLMAVGAAGLALSVVAAAPMTESALVSVWSYVGAVVSAIAFGIGYHPPEMFRHVWRKHDENSLRRATLAILRAQTADEVAERVLHPLVRIVNGTGAAMLAPDGAVMASEGDITRLDPGGAGARHGDRAARQINVPLADGRGSLVVLTGAYGSFFGHDDRQIIETMAAMVDVSLERCDLLAEEQIRQEALRRAREEADGARQEADRANQAKSEFLSRMSHELRTPLNAVLGFAQLMETSPLSDEDREGVDHILKAGRHLLDLINDVLDLSRVEAGELAVSLEPVHVAELLDDTMAFVRPLAASRSIELRVHGDRCDAHVLTDRQRARQVLLNLLSNAVKYNHDGGSVEVACSQLDDGIRVSVRDTGPGIDPGRRGLLFEPFQRLGAEDSQVEGTGLGLALTRQLVERLGGVIDVESTPGVGSTFWVDLPIADAPVSIHAPEKAPDRSVAPGAYRLLLVEDNLANVRVVEAVLRRRRPDIELMPAMQGGLAVDLATEHLPDLVLLDLHLPDLSGEQVLQRLRADPRTQELTIVIASADATPGRVRQLRDLGADDYIAKPYDVQQFLDVVDRALGHGDASRAAAKADSVENAEVAPAGF